MKQVMQSLSSCDKHLKDMNVKFLTNIKKPENLRKLRDSENAIVKCGRKREPMPMPLSSKILFSLFLVFSFFFSALTISEIFEDYIQVEKTKNVANKLLNIFAIIIPLITILGIFIRHIKIYI